MHLVTSSYFRSPNKDGSHAIRSSVAENRMLHAHFTTLCVTDAELLVMEFSHCGILICAGTQVSIVRILDGC